MFAADEIDGGDAGRILLCGDENSRFVLEPVFSTTKRGIVLYREGVAQSLCWKWDTATRLSFVLPRELRDLREWRDHRRRLDWWMIRCVLNLLHKMPAVSVGVNISGPSVVSDAVWESTFNELLEFPAIARHLIVEIDESESMPERRARVFVDRLRTLGCRVAIDGFGAKYGVAACMEIRSPDIIKINGSILAAARASRRSFERLRRVIELGADMAKEVVLLGVRSEADLLLAREAGAVWVQDDSHH
ncbi:EAL domain-containing protein [Burkholderia ubonensis]|uniref:EAL domain-containing protein n=1 Tax=Burkholderia ubonensis TaxID=101571 RepID=UPI000ADD52D8|nr:EAL domain-containing protein [Burkholderia ubonensis]